MSLLIRARMIIPQKLSNNSLLKKAFKGRIHHDEWVNFAHNRNCALQHAQGKTVMYSSLMQTTALREILYYLKG